MHAQTIRLPQPLGDVRTKVLVEAAEGERILGLLTPSDQQEVPLSGSRENINFYR